MQPIGHPPIGAFDELTQLYARRHHVGSGYRRTEMIGFATDVPLVDLSTDVIEDRHQLAQFIDIGLQQPPAPGLDHVLVREPNTSPEILSWCRAVNRHRYRMVWRAVSFG
ncbi:hypothetical protein [Nocardia sp. No.11]|uniref:hypothetical protein n=1 Tax=Nocardia sp. No.11 TaxID=3128861 RepID=UPI00319DD64F